MGVEPGEMRHTYRSTLSVSAAVASALMTLFFFGLWVITKASLNPVGAVLLLLLTARTMLIRVEADKKGLKIVNPYRTYRISWSDITGFHMGRFGGLDEGPSPLGFVARREGKPIGMLGVQKEEQVQELNQIKRLC